MKKFLERIWKGILRAFGIRPKGTSYAIRHARYLKRLELLEKSAHLEGME
jgi:hypothetical protein